MKASPRVKVLPTLFAGILVLALTALACNLPAGLGERLQVWWGSPTPSPAPTFTPQPLPPVIVETDPPAGSTISIGSPIRLYFNQDMDESSVEDALKGSPELAGDLIWEDASTLVFDPDPDLLPNQQIELTLSITAKAKNGLSLREPAQVIFYTPDFLQPATILPLPGGTEVDPTSAVVVSFNQPVVSLGNTDRDSSPAFTLNPCALSTVSS